MNEEEMATRDDCEKEENDDGGCDIDTKKKMRGKKSRREKKKKKKKKSGWPQHKPEVNQTYRSYCSLPLPPTELLPVTSLYLDFALWLVVQAETVKSTDWQHYARNVTSKLRSSSS
ncbi:hypothetical protein EAG_12004 [Camponotus floridanus]|uniref:Uncharacterized protein n=1 Tax=Camponotus floridanus TaxID=104421 RepID=E2AA86_CAMFO|nr:hypothetical protein EAG_12004 [Camponotus floridanus]